jgi:hypothetical protein
MGEFFLLVNQVATNVDADYGFHQRESGQFYTHFSLLRTQEAGCWRLLGPRKAEFDRKAKDPGARLAA